MSLLYPLHLLTALQREHFTKKRERSPLWPAYRKRFLRSHPSCSACGGLVFLQVHHVKPFHLYPTLELVETNLITLCMGPNECHLRVGHGGDWDAYNPFVVRHATLIFSHPEDTSRIMLEAMIGRKRVK